MSLLANDYPTRYAGVEDPLPFLMSLLESTDHPSRNKFSNSPRQRIYYGAPGTGKSNEIKRLTEGQTVIRTTFHPDSDYSTFVGAYKPTVKPVAEKYKAVAGKEEEITYSFVPQAFLQAYVSAWKNPEKPVYLIIEEINRGNCAQIFGDLFQLLDRDQDGYSEYPITADDDMRKQLAENFSGFHDSGDNSPDCDIINIHFGLDVKIRVFSGRILSLPPNLYIWATMNTSDQSLFPIDSAFKRRWEWKYVRICEGKKEDGTPLDYRIKFTIPAKGEQPEEQVDVKWWDFVKAINKQIEDATKSEDKKLGFFFCKPDKKANDTDDCNTIISAETFVGKVVFYLWQDVFKDYGFKGDIFKTENGQKISFHDFYPEDLVANKDTNPEGIDLALVKTFIQKVLDSNKDNPS